MGIRTLLLIALTTVALHAKAVSFMSLSEDLFVDSIEYTPMLILGEDAPQESTVPLAFILPGYREEDDESPLPDI